MTTETAISKSPQKPIDTVRAVFEKMKPQFAMVLPKHITPDRMVRVALTAIQNTPKLLDCDKQSLFSAVMRAAQLGLEPDGILGQAYLIPYAGKVQFIPGYRGLIDLARRSGEVSNIIAKEVCQNDEFTVDFSQDVPFTHRPKLNGNRGNVTHFWAFARFKDGGFHWDYMTHDEVVTIRNQSSGWQSALKYGKQAESPWEKHFIEMGKKTAIRRISKYLPMSVQKAVVIEDLVDAGKPFTSNEFGEIVLEDGEVIDNSEAGTKAKGSKKASKLDGFAATAHDPETGEVVEEATGEAGTTASEDATPAFLRDKGAAGKSAA
jgi:recombination protein RecT